jgi:hypothetical protein
MFITLSKNFCLALLMHPDDDHDVNAKNNSRNKDEGIWWPAWLFDTYNDLCLICLPAKLESQHYLEFLAASKSDRNIFRRKVAYLIGQHVPGNRRIIFNPKITPMNEANNDIFDRSSRYPGWTQASAEGALRSAAVIAIDSTLTKARSTKRPARSKHNKSQASLEQTAKKTKYLNHESGSRSTIRKPCAKAGQSKRSAISDTQEEAAHWSKSEAVVACRLTTARQKKLKNINAGISDFESEEEKHFYMFAQLWQDVLKPEGWTSVLSIKSVAPTSFETWWYVMPGRSAKSGTLGVDYFTSMDAVVQYCKTNHYYATYSTSRPAGSTQQGQGRSEHEVQEDYHDENKKMSKSPSKEIVAPSMDDSNKARTSMDAAAAASSLESIYDIADFCAHLITDNDQLPIKDHQFNINNNDEEIFI